MLAWRGLGKTCTVKQEAEEEQVPGHTERGPHAAPWGPSWLPSSQASLIPLQGELPFMQILLNSSLLRRNSVEVNVELKQEDWGKGEPADTHSARKSPVNCRAHNLGNISNTIFPGLVARLVRPCSIIDCHPGSQTMECIVEIKYPWKISRPHLCYKSVSLPWGFM
jgi:hypothetical protein